MPNSFIENINTLANATSLATGDIVEDTQVSRDEAVAAAEDANISKEQSALSNAKAKEWATKAHNSPVESGEYSSYHWSVESKFESESSRLRVINDEPNFVSSSYTRSGQFIKTELDTKSNIEHNHNGVYEPVITKKTAFNRNFTSISSDNGSSAEVARGDHSHSTLYEPKLPLHGTAFNKDFGKESGTVAQGDHLHNEVYEPKRTSKGTAYNKNFGTTEGTVAIGSHTHKAASISYNNTNTDINSGTVQGAITELNSVVSAVEQAEKCKLVAGMTDATYNIDIVDVDVPVTVNAGMTVSPNSKNTLYSNGIVVNYSTAPEKLIEGQFDVSMALEVADNSEYYMTPTINGVVVDTSFKAKVGDAGKAGSIQTLTLSGWMSNLNNLDVLGIAVANTTDDSDVVMHNMTISFAGQPEGALVSSGISVNHTEITARDAVQQHPTSSIYDSGSLVALDVLLNGKADYISNPIDGNIVSMDNNGNIADSGVSTTTLVNSMQKVPSATLDNIVVTDSQGQSKDGGLRIEDLALKNGNTAETFSVADSVSDYDSVNQGQLNATVSPLGTKQELLDHTALSNPHNTTYSDVGASAEVHSHIESDITGITDRIDSKYAKIPSAVSNNIPVFGVSGELVDSGYAALNPDIFALKADIGTVEDFEGALNA